MEIVWSQAVDRDLARIYTFLEPRSLRAVRGLIRRTFRAIEVLAEMLRVGLVADLGTEREYRQHVVEHYKIYYYVGDERHKVGYQGIPSYAVADVDERALEAPHAPSPRQPHRLPKNVRIATHASRQLSRERATVSQALRRAF